MSPTLVLDRGFRPHRVVDWRRAVTMLFAGKVEVIDEYDEIVRSPSISLRVPAVVRLLSTISRRRMSIKFTRVNVLARDGFRCQYCGRRLPPSALSLDHVIPRCRGGRTTWDNIVTACHTCNARKADRTPQQAGMRLRSRPERPRALPFLSQKVAAGSVPAAWSAWIGWQLPPEDRRTA